MAFQENSAGVKSGAEPPERKRVNVGRFRSWREPRRDAAGYSWTDGVSVVVRVWESQAHGEGRQQSQVVLTSKEVAREYERTA